MSIPDIENLIGFTTNAEATHTPISFALDGGGLVDVIAFSYGPTFNF